MFSFDVTNGGCSISDIDSENEIKALSKQIRKGAHKKLDPLFLSSHVAYQIQLTVMNGNTVAIVVAPLLTMLKRLDGTGFIDINALLSILMYFIWRVDYLCTVESASSIEEESALQAEMKSESAYFAPAREPYDLLLDRPSVVGLSSQLLANIKELQEFVVRDIEVPCWDVEVHLRLAERARDVLTGVICHDLKSRGTQPDRFGYPRLRERFSSRYMSDYYRFDVDGLCDICSDYETDSESTINELFSLYAYAVFVDIFAEARALVFYEPLVLSLMDDV